MKFDMYGDCPECGESWDAGMIWEAWRKMDNYADKSDDELKELAKEYYSKPWKFSKLVGIEVRGKYDGVSYWKCPFCGVMWDRFTGELVNEVSK